MTTQRDPFDLLASLNPIDTRPLVAGDDPVADASLARILAGGTTADSTVVSLDGARRRRRKWAVPVVVVGLLASGGVAAAWVAARHPKEPFVIGCQRTADVRSDTVFVSLNGEVDPVGLCAQPWTDGSLGTDGPPQLAACVTPDGQAVVMPGDAGVCTALGYAAYAATPDPQADAVRAANDAIFAFIQADPDQCVDLETAKREFRTIVDAYGLGDWKFSTEGIVYDSPCITAAFDRDQRIVFLPSGISPPG